MGAKEARWALRHSDRTTTATTQLPFGSTTSATPVTGGRRPTRSPTMRRRMNSRSRCPKPRATETTRSAPSGGTSSADLLAFDVLHGVRACCRDLDSMAPVVGMGDLGSLLWGGIARVWPKNKLRSDQLGAWLWFPHQGVCQSFQDLDLALPRTLHPFNSVQVPSFLRGRRV